MKIDITTLEYQFKFRDDNDFPATMILKIGQFEIKGFRIMASQYQDSAKRFFLKPPSNRVQNGKWLNIVWMDSKDDWSEFEKFALKKFDDEHTENLMKTSIK